MFYHLMLITNKNNSPLSQYLDFIKKCADAGITSLQLREKNLSYQELLEFGSLLIEILTPYNIPLVINDSSQLAKDLNTNYIHLGQQDDSIENSFHLIPNAQIGISIESEIELLQANQCKSLTYVTASAVFPSDNKKNIKKIWGLEGLKYLSEKSTHPLTAIGGINLDNVEQVLTHGAQGIALIGEIHNSIDPYQTTLQFKRKINNFLGH